MATIVEPGWISEELQRTQSAPAFLQALFTGHPDMLFVADPQGRIIAANSNSLRNLGYKRSDLEGKPIGLLVPLALRNRHLEHMHHYFSHPMGRKMGSGLSLSILDADGRGVPIDIELWPFSAGEIQYILTICRSLDEDIARRQMHIHALVETARDYAVNLLDDEGRILTWNEGAERMYGLTSAEALGQNYSILFLPSQRASNDPALQLEEARKSRNASEIACWHRLADGSDIWAEIRTSASRDASGAVICFTHVLHDATQHKRIEEDLRIANQSLRESAAQLENRVRDRTAQLEATVMELSEKKREVESYADRIAQDLKEKEVLLREIHHRVKNNLQVVQSLLKMRARTLQTSDAREAIESAIQRVQVIASVHENLYQMPDISQLPLSAYIKNVVEGAVNSGAACADQIEVKTEADDLPIAIDVAVPLGLLVNELILNCLKHGLKDRSAGKITVSITYKDGCRRLVIEDNGKGLPAGFNVEKCTSMGLKLATSLALRLGGTLQFSSNPGCRVEAILTRL